MNEVAKTAVSNELQVGRLEDILVQPQMYLGYTFCVPGFCCYYWGKIKKIVPSSDGRVVKFSLVDPKHSGTLGGKKTQGNLCEFSPRRVEPIGIWPEGETLFVYKKTISQACKVFGLQVQGGEDEEQS